MAGLATALVLTLPGTLAHAREAIAGSPSLSLTADRLHALAETERRQWLDYLSRSQTRLAADKASLAAERASLRAPHVPAVVAGDGLATMPLNRAAAWYGSSDARQAAGTIVSFQTPSGGWGKNQARNTPERLPGQWYVATEPSALRLARDPAWRHVGTIDNGATVTEIRFLAKVAEQSPASSAEIYRHSLVRGLNYLLEAQFPNGGWPQIWPLQGGYHDAVTLNDGAMVNVARLMGDAARADAEWRFLTEVMRAALARAERRAIALLLQLQDGASGRRSLWTQQYDALTLTPAPGRSYEPAALASAESARILVYLMALPQPDAAIVAAVDAGIAALRALAIENMHWHGPGDVDGSRLSPRLGEAPLWARYYDRITLRPIFGDRDGSIHHDIGTISDERRNGYAWFGREPAKAIATHATWRTRQPP